MVVIHGSTPLYGYRIRRKTLENRGNRLLHPASAQACHAAPACRFLPAFLFSQLR
jgi:hypothetical protein